jgi:hypothetical protein
MPQLTRDDLTRIIRDTLYATVGAGVLTVQQLDQVRRRLAERLSTDLGVGRHQVEQLIAVVEGQMSNLDARMKVLERQLDGVLDSVQERLPDQAGDTFAKARQVGAEARKAATEAGEKLTSFVRDSAA